MKKIETLLDWTLAVGIDLQISCLTKEQKIVSRAGINIEQCPKLSTFK